jgi:hypothetical protein
MTPNPLADPIQPVETNIQSRWLGMVAALQLNSIEVIAQTSTDALSTQLKTESEIAVSSASASGSSDGLTGKEAAVPLGQPFRCRINVCGRDLVEQLIEGSGTTAEAAILATVEQVCRHPLRVQKLDLFQREDGSTRCVVGLIRQDAPDENIGSGRSLSSDSSTAICMAMLRAANHGGWLQSEYRSNNQKSLRRWANQLTQELVEILGLGSLGEWKRAETEGAILDHLNRVASAAVITATNTPNEADILQLFDTSSWLYDPEGKLRDSYTQTDSWLAWYPGLHQPWRKVSEVHATLPKVPSSEIPWLIRLFENPESWFRFRGAIHLADHDVLHLLLGRGLQDQDEAFVLGFAMGTAKKVSRIQYHIFRWFIVHVYPEPYRIPKFVLPAFDFGVQCGIETGRKDLYREPLIDLMNLSLEEARMRCEIDVEVLYRYFRRERAAIPFTIASLRLPTRSST